MPVCSSLNLGAWVFFCCSAHPPPRGVFLRRCVQLCKIVEFALVKPTMANGYPFVVRRSGGRRPGNRRTSIRPAGRMPRAPVRRPKPIVRRQPVRVPRPIRQRVHPLAHAWHFDPADKKNESLPSSDGIGEHLTIDAVVRTPITTSATVVQYLILQWTTSHVRASILDGVTGQLTFLVSPQIQTASPLSVRAERESLRIRNTSVFTNIMGSVRVLSSPQQLLWSFTSPLSSIVDAAFLLRIGNMMNSHPAVRSYAGAEFMKTQAFITPPASNEGFKEWNRYDLPGTNTEIQTKFVEGALQTATNSVIFQFNTTSSLQTYDVAIHTQTAARFTSNVLFSNLVRPSVHIDPGVEHAAIQHLQQDAGRAFEEGELAAAASGPIWTAKPARPTPYTSSTG